MTEDLTAEKLRAILSYDPQSGSFTWLVPGKNQTSPGSEAGWVERNGYRRISIGARQYQAHRLAWLFMTGAWPPGLIDHVNMKKSDNRWVNLRLATASQNSANRRATARSSSGVKGVYWHRRIKKWQASIMVDGRLICLGYRDNRDDAAALYASAATQHFGPFARTA